MAWSLPRGTIFRCFRSQSLTPNRKGSSLRSLSSDGRLVDNKIIISSDPFADSLKSLSLDSGPGDYNKTIISSDPFADMELIQDDVMRIGEVVSSDYFTEGHVIGWEILENDDICRAVDSTEAFLDQVIRCEKKTGIVYKALNVISNHSIFETCSPEKKLKILSTVLDRIRNYSQADSREVFLMNVFIRSMSNDDNKSDDITKDEVISRVLDIIQSYPKVVNKVTEETHFGNDLGFDDFDIGEVQKALYLEFKLFIRPKKLLFNDTCKQVIEYIYENRMDRMDLEKFRMHNMIGNVFWPRPSEKE